VIWAQADAATRNALARVSTATLAAVQASATSVQVSLTPSTKESRTAALARRALPEALQHVQRLAILRKGQPESSANYVAKANKKPPTNKEKLDKDAAWSATLINFLNEGASRVREPDLWQPPWLSATELRLQARAAFCRN
jgi:hypothetical protein